MKTIILKEKLKDFKFDFYLNDKRWREVEVEELSIKNYIKFYDKIPYNFNVKTTNKRFLNVIDIRDKIINTLAREGKSKGKKMKMTKYFFEALFLIEKYYDKNKENIYKILVEAISNVAPIEDVVTLKIGGSMILKAMDISPAKRVDMAVRNICLGAYNNSSKKPVSIQEALAKEIIESYYKTNKSFAYSKKLEKERIAKSSR